MSKSRRIFNNYEEWQNAAEACSIWAGRCRSSGPKAILLTQTLEIPGVSITQMATIFASKVPRLKPLNKITYDADNQGK